MVLVDDMRWDDMRVAGHPFIDTPNMDRLAREGARFTNAFATTPLCSPSRASFLTGQYPHTNGIIDNTARPSHNLRVFPLELQRAGYRTGFFGKYMNGYPQLWPNSTTPCVSYPARRGRAMSARQERNATNCCISGSVIGSAITIGSPVRITCPSTPSRPGQTTR